MTVQDPDQVSVTMDRAEDAGLMGWPDIVGKAIRFELLGEARQAKVLAVGPVGAMVEWETTTGRTTTTLRGLVPWGTPMVWEVASETEPARLWLTRKDRFGDVTEEVTVVDGSGLMTEHASTLEVILGSGEALRVGVEFLSETDPQRRPSPAQPPRRPRPRD